MCEKPETTTPVAVACDYSTQRHVRPRPRSWLGRLSLAMAVVSVLGVLVMYCAPKLIPRIWTTPIAPGSGPSTIWLVVDRVPYVLVISGPLGAVAGIASLVRRRRERRGSVAGTCIGLVMIGLIGYAVLHRIAQDRFYRQFGSTEGLREVHNAAEQYQRRHQALPPDLPTLVAERMASGKPQVPWLGRKRCDPPTGRTYDFLYMPPAAGTPPTTVVACDLRGNQEDDARFVLYADGRVSGLLSPAAFAAELARPENAAFAAALRAAEGP